MPSLNAQHLDKPYNHLLFNHRLMIFVLYLKVRTMALVPAIIPFLPRPKPDRPNPDKPDDSIIDADVISNDGNLDIFNSMVQMVPKPVTKTANTSVNAPFAPGEIGTAINPLVDDGAKQVVRQVGNFHPGVHGLEPERKAQLNLLAETIMPKAEADAKFYTDKAGKIMSHAANIHESQVQHKANAFRSDLKVKAADVKHLGAIQDWQQQTVSLVNQAREKHAGIQMAANCL